MRAPGAGSPVRVRVGTYNVLHGLPVLGAAAGARPEPGVPTVADDGPLRAAVAALDADVLGLQEVDCAQPRSGCHHQVQSAAAAMGAKFWYFAPSVRGTPGDARARWRRADADDERRANQAAPMEPIDGPVPPAAPGTTAGLGEPRGLGGLGGLGGPGASGGLAGSGGSGEPLYGVGLVSRLPVLEWRSTVFDAAPFALPLLVHAHPRPRLMLIPDEPRAAIAAVVSGPSGVFTVATVHLSFVPGYNVHQLRRLRTWLTNLPRPLVVLGDLNLPGSLPARVTGWAPLARGATYPAPQPRVQLDHALADGLSAAQVAGASCQVHRLPVSDHCALTVDVDI